jgi:hypothetical protein
LIPDARHILVLDAEKRLKRRQPHGLPTALAIDG